MSDYVGWYGHQRRQDWRTPPDLFRPLHDRFGFTLDGAADDGNGLLPLASTPEATISWEGQRVFCNPPWSAIKPFVEEAVRADLAVLLVPARTNARWFHRALELGARVEFFLGRVKFDHDDNHKGHNSPVDCLLLIFGGEPAPSAEALTAERLAEALRGDRLLRTDYYSPPLAASRDRLMTVEEWAAAILARLVRMRKP